MLVVAAVVPARLTVPPYPCPVAGVAVVHLAVVAVHLEAVVVRLGVVVALV